MVQELQEHHRCPTLPHRPRPILTALPALWQGEALHRQGGQDLSPRLKQGQQEESEQPPEDNLIQGGSAGLKQLLRVLPHHGQQNSQPLGHRSSLHLLLLHREGLLLPRSKGAQLGLLVPLGAKGKDADVHQPSRGRVPNDQQHPTPLRAHSLSPDPQVPPQPLTEDQIIAGDVQPPPLSLQSSPPVVTESQNTASNVPA